MDWLIILAIIIIAILTFLLFLRATAKKKLCLFAARAQRLYAEVFELMLLRRKALCQIRDIFLEAALREKQSLTEVVFLRKVMTIDQRADALRRMNSLLSQLSLTAQAFPQQRTESDYDALYAAASNQALEEKIEEYNYCARVLQQLVRVFPSQQIAAKMKIEAPPIFDTSNAKKGAPHD